MGIAAGFLTVLMFQAGTAAPSRQVFEAPTYAAATGVGITTSGSVDMKPLGTNFDTPPTWVRMPDSSQVGALFPAEAIRLGRNGMAEIKCTLTVDSALRSCSVVNETAGDLGFGRAAIGLTADLNLRPAMSGGRPVATEVSLTAHFQGPNVQTGTYLAGVKDETLAQTLVSNADWLRTPTYSAVVAAYPERARSANVGGRVALLCFFGEDGRFGPPCQITNEEPAGFGFGQAALSLSEQFQARATLPDGQSVDGAAYRLPITFSTRMLDASTTVTGHPEILALPTLADMQAAFPREAVRGGVGTSRVTLSCDITTGGALAPCAVASETPTGLGFGQAALQLAPKFRMSQWSDDGLPVVGGKVNVPVGYNLEVRPRAAAQ